MQVYDSPFVAYVTTRNSCHEYVVSNARFVYKLNSYSGILDYSKGVIYY